MSMGSEFLADHAYEIDHGLPIKEISIPAKQRKPARVKTEREVKNMGISVLILGVSGTGKSASMRNFGKDEIALVNVAGKPLPFKGKFTETLNSDDYDEIEDFIRDTKKTSIVIDDAQYLMGNEFMRRVTERGYDKFSEMAQNFFNLLHFINTLKEEKIVYLLGHIERDQDGNEKFKTMGKLIDQCINVEGTCTIVLKTSVSDGKYNFLTQNSGKDTVKSPIGMFPSFAIENDLKYVDEKIRNYYEFDGAVSDEAMAMQDKAAASDVTPEQATGKRKRSRKKADDDQTPPVKVEDPENDELPEFMNIPEGVDEEVPFDEFAGAMNPPEKRASRRKRGKAEVADVDTGTGAIVGGSAEDAEDDAPMTGAKAAFEKAKAKLAAQQAEQEETADEEAPATRRTRRRR